MTIGDIYATQTVKLIFLPCEGSTQMIPTMSRLVNFSPTPVKWSTMKMKMYVNKIRLINFWLSSNNLPPGPSKMWINFVNFPVYFLKCKYLPLLCTGSHLCSCLSRLLIETVPHCFCPHRASSLGKVVHHLDKTHLNKFFLYICCIFISFVSMTKMWGFNILAWVLIGWHNDPFSLTLWFTHGLLTVMQAVSKSIQYSTIGIAGQPWPSKSENKSIFHFRPRFSLLVWM